jgi:hypothetical protein
MPIQQHQLSDSAYWAELWSQIEALSTAEKLQLLQWLTTSLLNEAGLTPLGQSEDPVILLRRSSEAASILATALAEHQATHHG